MTALDQLARFETLPTRIMVGRFIEAMPRMQPGQLVDVMRAASSQLSAYQASDEIPFICDAIDRDLRAEDEPQTSGRTVVWDFTEHRGGQA